MVITGGGPTDFYPNYPVSDEELLIVCLLQLVAAFLWTYVLAAFCDIAANSNPALVAFRQRLDALNVLPYTAWNTSCWICAPVHRHACPAILSLAAWHAGAVLFVIRFLTAAVAENAHQLQLIPNRRRIRWDALRASCGREAVVARLLISVLRLAASVCNGWALRGKPRSTVVYLAAHGAAAGLW